MDFIKEDLINYYIRSIFMGISEDDIWWDGFRYKVLEKDGVSHLCLFDISSDILDSICVNSCIYIPDVFSFFSEKLCVFFLNFDFAFDLIANGIIYIPDYLFEFTKIRNITLKSCVHIGKNSFAKTNSLNLVDVPNIEWIDSLAFWDSSLKEIDITNVIFIGKEAFRSCHNTKFNSYFPNLESLSYSSFESSNIDCMIAPKLIIVERNAFLCSKIKKFIGESVTVIDNCAFMGSMLEEIEVINLNELHLRSLSKTLITSFKAEKCTYAHIKAFDRCILLKDLYLPLVNKNFEI